MRRFKNFNEEDWSQMGDRSKDWTRRQYQKAVAAGDKERAKDFIDTYGRGVTLKVGHGQDAQGKEIGKFGEPAFKKRIDKIKKDKTEAVEVDDISVGKKKKKPTGVKADEPLKGFAYNEKRVTDIDVEQSARELKKAKLDKAKEKVQKEEQEEKFFIVKVTGKGAPGKDYMNVKTRATSQKAALEKIRKQHPGNSYSIVKEDYDTAISLAMEEIETNEALSPKEKEKRLLMIKKAVEKLNKANIDKAKKMAMRDMKASGMFDDAIDEETELEEARLIQVLEILYDYTNQFGKGKLDRAEEKDMLGDWKMTRDSVKKIAKQLGGIIEDVVNPPSAALGSKKRVGIIMVSTRKDPKKFDAKKFKAALVRDGIGVDDIIINQLKMK